MERKKKMGKKPPPNRVENHPKIEDINRDIIKGTCYREIGKKYGFSKSVVTQYVRRSLSKEVMKAEYERELRSGESVLDEINSNMRYLRKMLRACDAYLQDPDNPEKYYLGPRSEEIDVSYLDLSDEEHPIRRKKKLQELLDEASSGKEILSVDYKYKDPRQLLLNTTDSINKQTELLARIMGQIKDITVNVIHTEVWADIQKIILDSTKGHPGLREKIAGRLKNLN